MKFKFSYGLFLLMINTINLQGQEFFYNTHHFGLESSILGGAVTAGNDDLVMAFYNPAALKHVTKKVGVSLFQPSLQRFGFGRLLGESNIDYDLDLEFSANMTAYMLDVMNTSKLTLIVLDKSNWDNELAVEKEIDNGSIYNDQFFSYKYQGSVTWAGAAFSYPISDRWSFGISQFFSSSRFNYSYETINQNSTTNPVLFSEFYQVRYGNYSMVTKIGFHLQTEKHRCGMTLKTPNFGQVSKSGDFTKQTTILNNTENSFNNIIDVNLESKVNSPWSFDIGYVFKLKKKENFWLNLSYNSRVPEYEMAKIDNRNGSTISLMSGNETVFNTSVGLSGHLNKNLELILGFRTNFFAYENEIVPDGSDIERLYLLDKDKYHMTFGTEYQSGRNDFSFGIDASFVRPKSENEFADFPNLAVSNERLSDFSHTRVRLLITYGFLFNNWKSKE